MRPKQNVPDLPDLPTDPVSETELLNTLNSLPAKYIKVAEKMTTTMSIHDFLDIRHPDYPEIPLFTELLIQSHADVSVGQYFYKELK